MNLCPYTRSLNRVIDVQEDAVRAGKIRSPFNDRTMYQVRDHHGPNSTCKKSHCLDCAVKYNRLALEPYAQSRSRDYDREYDSRIRYLENTNSELRRDNDYHKENANRIARDLSEFRERLQFLFEQQSRGRNRSRSSSQEFPRNQTPERRRRNHNDRDGVQTPWPTHGQGRHGGANGRDFGENFRGYDNY